MTAPTRREEKGFEILRLENDALAVEVIPALGGRISSLRRRDSGREWLWRLPGRDHLRTNGLDDPFDQSPLMGIDECVPSVAGCAWNGRAIPDHGEIWSREWRASAGDGILCEIDLPRSPFRFSRRVWLSGDDVVLSYALKNLGPDREPCLWCFHPVFTIAEGDRIWLPAGVESLAVYGSQSVPWNGETWAWPVPGPGGDLSCLDLGPEPSSAKLFASGFTDGHAGIVNDATGDRLELHWDAEKLPHLGLWICRGGWLNAHQLAIEPTNAPMDGLDEAVAAGELGVWFEPEQEKTWELMLRLPALR